MKLQAAFLHRGGIGFYGTAHIAHKTAEPVASEYMGKTEIKMPAKKKSKTSKRTVIEPHKGDRRYVRRNKKGEFNKEVNVARSLAADRRRKATTKAKKGQGDRGDVKKGFLAKLLDI